MTKRVLVVAYLFPPVGGAGVQRVSKFVKYLPRHGWDCSVLTVANPSVPLFDQSLTVDIPAATVIRRATTWEPHYRFKKFVSSQRTEVRGLKSEVRSLGTWFLEFGSWNGRMTRTAFHRLSRLLLQPDPQILWVPHAIRQGRQLLHDLPHAAIMVTAPPFSSFFVGRALARESGLPLVLDYRDEWTLTANYWENRRVDWLSRRIQRGMERRMIRSAQALIATTQASAQVLDRIRAKAGSHASVTHVYNGFDPDDFSNTPNHSPKNGAPYRLAYVGTLWNLTSVEPLVKAVRRLLLQQPGARDSFELCFIGRRMKPQQDLIDGLKQLSCRIVEFPYVEHRECMEVVRSADALCLLLSDLPGAERVVPAKIFEYLAARKPLLAISPPGEVWDILRDYPVGAAFTPDDVEGTSQWLATQLLHHERREPAYLNGWDPSRFGRDRQARQLADILDSLTTSTKH
jgi:glycosyltransferase involved in cell wall biosynthesis